MKTLKKLFEPCSQFYYKYKLESKRCYISAACFYSLVYEKKYFRNFQQW